MRKPDISTQSSDPELDGSNSQSSWVQGRNRVYRHASNAQYRVAILTESGWKSYGHFNNLDTAAYVANVAILIEGCEERYQLNEVDAKDRDELSRWRKTGGNADREREARGKHKDLLAKRGEFRAAALRLEQEKLERAQAEEMRLQQVIVTRRQETEAKKRHQQEREAELSTLITSAPNAALLEMLTRDIGGERHRKIHAEIARRENVRKSGT